MVKDRALEPRVLVWEALADSIVVEARRTPLAILLDDLHHSDTDSACLFEVVAERAGDAPLFLAAAYRPVEMGRDPVLSASLSRTVRGASPLSVELKGLGLDGTSELLTVEIGSAPTGELLRCAHDLLPELVSGS